MGFISNQTDQRTNFRKFRDRETDLELKLKLEGAKKTEEEEEIEIVKFCTPDIFEVRKFEKGNRKY